MSSWDSLQSSSNGDDFFINILTFSRMWECLFSALMCKVDKCNEFF